MINLETGVTTLDILFANIQSCLLNILFIYFCFTIYFKFLERNLNTFTNAFIIVLVCGVSIVFSMTFPILFIKEIPIDIRQIPLIVGAFYGGRRVTFVLTGILLGYRLYLGIPDFALAFCVYSLQLTLLCIVFPYFKNTVNLRKKLWIALGTAVLASSSTTALNVLFLPLPITVEFLVFSLILVIIQATGVLFCVWFTEKARKDLILSKEVAKLEKLKTVSTIAASISHEVRNPLTVTKGFLQLLYDSGLSEQEREYYINTALEALEKAESTITDYLTFAKPSLENVKVLSLHKELISVKNLVSPYAAMNNVEIEIRLEKNIYIAGEKEKLHQLFINILKNGIEAMPQGGTLKIELKCFKSDAIITIADTGIGMDEEQLERLGNPFFTTKDIGTGLGTMVVYSVVKAMGGKIHVDSTPGTGTSFTVLLPTVEAAEL